MSKHDENISTIWLLFSKDNESSRFDKNIFDKKYCFANQVNPVFECGEV